MENLADLSALKLSSEILKRVKQKAFSTCKHILLSVKYPTQFLNWILSGFSDLYLVVQVS